MNPPPAHPHTRRSLAAFNWQISLRSVYETVCGVGSFVFVSFTLALGIAKEKLGFLVSIVSFACLSQMLGLLLADRVHSPKKWVIRLAFIEPLLLILCVVALPFVTASLRFPLLGLGVFLTASVLHLTRPVTDEWLASSIPGSIRGRYLGRRLQIASLALILSIAAAGQFARLVDKADAPRYALLLAAGALFGLLAVFALNRAHLPAADAAHRFNPADLPAILKNKPFRNCLLVLLIYNLPFWFAMPFYQVFYLRVLHMTEPAIATLLVLYCIIKILFSPMLGRWLERVGPRTVIFWLTFPYLLLFFAFTVSTPTRIWPLWLAWTRTGFAEAGFSLALTHVLYESVPNSGARKAFFVVHNLMLFAAAGVFAACASGLAEFFKDRALQLGPWRLEQFHLFYLVCTLALIPCAFGSLALLPASRKPKARP